MKEVIIAILLIVLFNTILLMRHMYKKDCNCNKENFDTNDRLSTRYGPYNGITFCSGVGARTQNNPNRKIGDDSALFN
jgi:hypothetical protein